MNCSCYSKSRGFIMKLMSWFKANLNPFRDALSVTLICLLCGCATMGRDFNHQNIDSLEIGQTRSSDYQAMFGKPIFIEVKENADGKFEWARYTYAYSDLGATDVRLLDLEFRNGLLNAYNHISSFDKDKTVGSADQLSQITRGTSKKSDVLLTLGKPHGMARCPSYMPDFQNRCSKGTEVLEWAFVDVLASRGGKLTGHNIFIVFDKNDIVTNMEKTTDP
jgi:hypothetical protein